MVTADPPLGKAARRSGPSDEDIDAAFAPFPLRRTGLGGRALTAPSRATTPITGLATIEEHGLVTLTPVTTSAVLPLPTIVVRLTRPLAATHAGRRLPQDIAAGRRRIDRWYGRRTHAHDHPPGRRLDDRIGKSLFP